MPPIPDPTPASASALPAEAAPLVTSGAGHAEPVVDESAAKTTGPVAAAAAADAPVEAKPAETTKPGAPPAQAGDEAETHVAEAKPVLLPSVEDAKKELAANPSRASVLSSEGIVVREG